MWGIIVGMVDVDVVILGLCFNSFLYFIFYFLGFVKKVSFAETTWRGAGGGR